MLNYSLHTKISPSSLKKKHGEKIYGFPAFWRKSWILRAKAKRFRPE